MGFNFWWFFGGWGLGAKVEPFQRCIQKLTSRFGDFGLVFSSLHHTFFIQNFKFLKFLQIMWNNSCENLQNFTIFG
jgi:hypothetical protein